MGAPSLCQGRSAKAAGGRIHNIIQNKNKKLALKTIKNDKQRVIVRILDKNKRKKINNLLLKEIVKKIN
jgi:hypothetical protein